MTSFAGLSAFPMTPANQNGSSTTRARSKVCWDVWLGGRRTRSDFLESTGSYVFFTREERRRAIGIAARKVEERTPLLVGIGALRTDEAVKLAQDARTRRRHRWAARRFHTHRFMDDEVFTHFETVARLRKAAAMHLRQPGHDTISVHARADRSA